MFTIITMVASVLVAVAGICISVIGGNIPDHKKSDAWDSRGMRIFIAGAIVFSIGFAGLVLSGCSGAPIEHPDATVDATVDATPDAEVYQCRTDCNCDLNYCPSISEPMEGRWQLDFYEEFRWDEEANFEGEVEFPYSDEETGCASDVQGSISIIPYEKENWANYFSVYYGYFYGHFDYKESCPHTSHSRSTNIIYWYWSLCIPRYLWCGMILYDEYGIEHGEVESEGGFLYDYTGERDDRIWWLTTTLDLDFNNNFTTMMHSEFNFVGEVGECETSQYHCYLQRDCNHLIADCTPTAEECKALGGSSYSEHQPEHMREQCHSF